MDRAERLRILQQKARAQKEGTPIAPAASRPPAAPAPTTAPTATATTTTTTKKEGYMNFSTLNDAFASIIYITLILIAAFVAYKFIWPMVARGGKRALNGVKGRARGLFRYSK
jgi:hypothetical protein